MKEQDIDQQLRKQETADRDSTYHLLMQALDREPTVASNRTLADGELHKLAKKKERSKRNYWLSMVLMTTVFVMLGFGTIVIFMGWESFREIKDLSIYAILIGLMVVAIQYLDDKIWKRDLRFS